MPVKPLVSKIRVHNPNKRGSSKANTNYVTYIATREGVSLEQVKNVDDLLQMDGMMKKDLDETVIHQEANNEDYLEYMAKRPRSHGLFGNIDTDDLKAVAREVSRVSNSGRIIYRGIISLCGEDATNLGFKDSKSWYNYLRKVMPDIAKELGVSSYNHTWVAAFHAEEAHPHVHYELWDNRDTIKSPYIHVAQQNRIREMLSGEMFDNEYEQAIREVHQEELQALKENRNLGRKNILEMSAQMLKDIEYVPGSSSQKLPDRSKPGELQYLTKKLNEFVEMLPGKGRLNYKLLPSEAKGKLDEIAELILKRTDIGAEKEKYLAAVEDMHILYGESKKEIQEARQLAENDIRKRMENRILKEIKPLLIEPEIIPGISEAAGKILEEDQEKHQRELLDEGIWEDQSLLEDTEVQGQDYYIEWNRTYKNAMQLLYGENKDIEKAFEILEKEAINGNAIAIDHVAKLIERELVKIPREESAEYYSEAVRAFQEVYKKSDNEYIREYAAYKVGKLFERAKGELSEPDYEGSAHWYREAVHNKFAEYSLAKMYLDKKVFVSSMQSMEENQGAAVKLLMSSEGKGNPFAAYELGNCYKRGIGVACSQSDANEHYKAALAGFLNVSQNTTDDNLLYRIGKMYMLGMGTEVDVEKGMNFIKKAADLKNENAIIAYARYLYEKGMPDEKTEAIKLFEEIKDNRLAEYYLAKIHFDEAGPVFDMEKGLEYLQRSADQGNQYAQYKLGSIYTNEKMTYYDLEKAMEYLQKSADQENQYAQYKLGSIYADDELTCYNIEKAMEYLQKSADQENQYAQYKLGSIYADDELTCYNIEKAMEYLQKSAEQENQYAQCRLGMIYLFGKGVEKNKEIAEYWLKRSADQGNIFAKDLLNNDGFVGINFSYCLIKSVLQVVDNMHGQLQDVNNQSRLRDNKQAMKEYMKNRDGEQKKETEYGV